MIEKIFKKIVYLPFFIPFVYRFKLPLKNFMDVNFLDIFLIILITLGLLIIHQKKLWQDFILFIKKEPLFLLIGLLIILGFFSILMNFNSNFLSNLSLLKSFFILPVLFSFLIKYFTKKNLITFWKFFYVYLVYSSFLSLFSIYFWLSGRMTYDNRVKLFFDSPNQLAIALSLGLISLVILCFHKKNNLLFLLPLFVISILLTKSTGALVSLILISLLFIFGKNLSWLKKTVTLTLIGAIFSIILILSIDPIINFFNIDPFQNKNSFDSRLVIYLSSQKLILNNFWTGVGMGNFQTDYLKNQALFPPYPQWAVPHSHNLFSEVWLSFGLLGLLTWIILLIKKIISTGDNFSKITLIFLAYFLIHGIVEVPISTNSQALFFWFILIF